MKYYIAYGSNLSVKEISERCPSAQLVGTSLLKDYKLEFKSVCGDNAFATITPYKNEVVPVAVFKITHDDEYNLDKVEGVKVNHYFKEELDVVVNNTTIKGMVYIMNLNAKYGYPPSIYLDTISEGYKNHNFDISYLKKAILVSNSKVK